MKGGIFKKTISILIITLLMDVILFSSVLSSNVPSTITTLTNDKPQEVYVDDSWFSQEDVDTFNTELKWLYDAFNNIKDAIGNVNTSGKGIVFVRNGQYNIIDGLSINFPLKLIGLEDGCIIEGDSEGNVIKIFYSNVEINGFVIKYSLKNQNKIAGIRLYNYTSNITILNNKIIDNSIGIYGEETQNVTIVYNEIRNNTNGGIILPGTETYIFNNIIENNDGMGGIVLKPGTGKNKICNNTIKNNNDNGIKIDSSSENNIENNTIENNTKNGIFLFNSHRSNLTNNSIFRNGKSGIRLFSSSNNIIFKNCIKNNGPTEGQLFGYAGILLTSSNNNDPCGYNQVYNNTIRENYHGGILIYSSNYNTFYGNDIISNGFFGFRISYTGSMTNSLMILKSTEISTGNKIYHNNFIDNGYYQSANAVDPNNYQKQPQFNQWDNGEVDDSTGFFSEKGGNYWDDYESRCGFIGFNHSTGIWNESYGICIQRDTFSIAVPIMALLFLFTFIGMPISYILMYLMKNWQTNTIYSDLNSYDNHPWFRQSGWRNFTQFTPEIPTIMGPSSGKINESLCFEINSTDIDNDSICYEVNWGNGEVDISPYHPSGEVETMCNIWNHELPYKIYNVTARSIDNYGLKSNWSDPYFVNITRN